MFLALACSCLCAIYWSHVLSGEWRCSWCSADRVYTQIGYETLTGILTFKFKYHCIRFKSKQYLHYSDVLWASWRLKSLTTRLLKFIRAINKETIKAPHHWSFIIINKEPVMRKASLCQYYTQYGISVSKGKLTCYVIYATLNCLNDFIIPMLWLKYKYAYLVFIFSQPMIPRHRRQPIKWLHDQCANKISITYHSRCDKINATNAEMAWAKCPSFFCILCKHNISCAGANQVFASFVPWW